MVDNVMQNVIWPQQKGLGLSMSEYNVTIPASLLSLLELDYHYGSSIPLSFFFILTSSFNFHLQTEGLVLTLFIVVLCILSWLLLHLRSGRSLESLHLTNPQCLLSFR